MKDFCEKECIEFHTTKPNSHTGNADVERFNGTLTEKIRVLNLEQKLPIRIQILKAIEIYNNSYHSTIKTTPLTVQNKEVDFKVIYERLLNSKEKIIRKRNEKRENYEEHRKIGFIKNYKSLRHKEEPKFRKYSLSNVRETNIKRPFKFSDQLNENHSTVDHLTTNTNDDYSNNDN